MCFYLDPDPLKRTFMDSVSDAGGSGFKLPDWIQIRIRNMDPDPGSPLFQRIFHDFSLIFKMIGTK